MLSLVRLGEAILSWLHAKLDGRGQEDDLERTYAFSHELNADQILKKCTNLPTYEDLLWWVGFLCRDKAEVLDAPLARRLFPNQRLWSMPGAAGPVALNGHICVRSEFKRRGFARAIYQAERELYLRWGVREVQIRALGDGPSVWVRHFGFLPKEPELLENRYSEWAARNGRSREPPPTAADYPEAFLSTHQGLMLYKVVE